MAKHTTTSQIVFDTAFPPNKQSLFGKQDPLPEFRVWDHYKWISPKPFYAGVPYSLHASVTPAKIILGSEPACPLLAAMAALGLKPARIQALICQSAHSEVFFDVKFFRDGEPQTIRVDHFFPHNPVTKSFVFLASDAREIWPMLIEKAYAKMLGSYQAMLGPDKDESLTKPFDVLTGCPSYTIKHKGPGRDMAWRQMQKAYLRYYPMIARAEKTQCVVVELVEVQGKDSMQRSVRLIVWDPQLLSKSTDFVPIKENDQNTNLYDLKFSTYLTLFQETAVNKYKNEYGFNKSLKVTLESRVESPHVFSASSSPKAAAASAIMDTSGVHLVTIEAVHNFSAYATLYQLGKPETKCRHGMLLGFLPEGGEALEFRDCIPYRTHPTDTLELNNRKKGTYYCIIQVDLDTVADSEFKFVIQGNSNSTVVKQVAERGKIKESLLELVKAYALARGTRADIVESKIYEYHFKDCLNILFGKYFVNETADSTLISTFTVEKGVANFVAPYRGDKAMVRVSPGKTEYFLVLWTRSEQAPVIKQGNYVEKSKEKVLQEVKEGAKKSEQRKEIAPGVFFVQYKYDCGMLFAVENHSKHMLYKGAHKFSLKNLTLDEEGCGVNEIKTMIPPENTTYKWAYVGDMFQKVECTVTHEGELQTYDKGSSTLINEMIKTGAVTKIGKAGAIWTKIIEDHWCMYIKNFAKRVMHITIEIKRAINLKCADGEKWEAVLKPGEGFVKRVQSKNPFNVSNCKWHAICNME